MKYSRVYTDPAGESHFDDVEVEFAQADFAPPAPPVNLSSFSPASQYVFSSLPTGWWGDWHPAPQRQILFLLSGGIAVQVSDGEVRHFGAGSVLLLDDTTGKGHVSWNMSETNTLSAIVQLPN